MTVRPRDDMDDIDDPIDDCRRQKSEGTMHTTAQRPTPRLARLLACAAVVPVMFVAGCSLGSSDDSKEAAPGSEASKSAEAAPKVEPAKFAKLPRPCDALGKKTVKDLVPKAKNKSGSEGKSADLESRSSCSWNGLDGFQYRWLDVSFQRFESDASLGSGSERAGDYFTKQVAAAKSVKGAKKLKTATTAGVGDQATTLSYDLKKDKDDFRNQTTVVRTANVVITVNYNGTGYEDAKTPKAEDMVKDVESAAKEAVKAVEDTRK
ncbi:DUF3558 domain-containing protein [Streptomyces sp. NPDC047108]|uniref:DUF3558 domain-containing protein n=1 Tax=Streptomyces sp. NPDC047108 TaxID=3155025 RepID=UPI0033E71E3B